MNDRHTTALLALLALTAGCGGGGGGSGPVSPPGTGPLPPVPPDAPTGTARPTVDTPVEYNDVAVHDPSVVADGEGGWVVIGSHLAMARTGDLVSWALVADGVDDTNPLFDTYESEIAEGIAWTGGHVGSWAADIIRLADGRYYFYYSHCATADDGLCDAPRSYLGVAVADDIEGPYEDLGIFLWSGQTDAEIAAGHGVGAITSFDGNVHPNVIDPALFFDADDRLWMTYGSYAGGIFILEMDESTGLPLPDQGYGRRLAGGRFSAIEGSYVLYSPVSGYYYLFLSFGGFAAADGYNIRLARSRNPDGPYLDAAGNDLASAAGGWAEIEPYGVKLMGGFDFASDAGDPAPDHGYRSPGHNSALYDEQAGKHLLVTHTRFPGRGEQHAVRVHEMFLGSDDWLLVSPHRYAVLGGDNRVGSDEVAGTWQFVNHEKDINREPKPATYIKLQADGSLSGSATGTWTVTDESMGGISLAIDGLGSFDGVVKWQWDAGLAELTPALSALSANGASLWGSKLPDADAATVVQAVLDALDPPERFSGAALDLPVTGHYGATIEWHSDNPGVISEAGRIARPNVGDGDQTVGLTATVTLDGETSTVTRFVTVPQRYPFNRSASFAFENNLSENLGHFAAAMPTGDRLWKAGAGTIAYTAGRSGQALVLDGSNGVRLPDSLIGNHEYTVSFWVNPAVLTPYSTAFFGAVNEINDDADPSSNHWISLVPQGWDDNTMLWSGSETWFDGTTGERIPAATWSHVAFSIERGLVNVYVDGEEKFSSGNLGDYFSRTAGRFALGVNYWDVPFDGVIDELRIYDAALSTGEIRALDIENRPSDELLQSAADLLDLGDLSAVKDDLYLPPTGPFAAAIDWTSSGPAIVIDGTRGIVTRPGGAEPAADVMLTAMLSLDGQTTSRTFDATVSNLAAPEPIAHYRFESDLTDSTEAFPAGTTTGGFITAAGGVASFENGVTGQALVLDGSTGIALGDGLVTDATWSFSLWIRPASLTAYTTVLFGGPSCAAGAESCESWVSVVPAGLGADGETMLWSGTAWYDALAGERIAVGDWTHFTGVNDNGRIAVYLDGEPKFSGENFPDIFTGQPDAKFWIGVNHWDPAFAGSIDELRFYDEVLTPDEVADVCGGTCAESR